jgi:hypothetical protein
MSRRFLSWLRRSLRRMDSTAGWGLIGVGFAAFCLLLGSHATPAAIVPAWLTAVGFAGLCVAAVGVFFLIGPRVAKRLSDPVEIEIVDEKFSDIPDEGTVLEVEYRVANNTSTDRLITRTATYIHGRTNPVIPSALYAKEAERERERSRRVVKPYRDLYGWAVFACGLPHDPKVNSRVRPEYELTFDDNQLGEIRVPSPNRSLRSRPPTS